MEREFKYYYKDFGVLKVKVLHMDLLFDIFDDHTKVNSKIILKTLNKPVKTLELNANSLELINLSSESTDAEYDYKKELNKIIINFKKAIPKNTEFVINTETICRPTKNILEGLYYDETPKNSPPTQITQCQQWGFQRLVPCIDDMTAKCTYRTRIIADKRYTHLITNGDVVEERKPATSTRDIILYENIKTPMAPYLFFLGVGTYESFTKDVEYPDGDKFTIELIVPPGSDKTAANKAIDILYHAIIWIYLFTGKDKYKDVSKKQKLYELIKERDKLRDLGKDISHIRTELKNLIFGLGLGYKYTGTIYREIGMQNSNFGGMENVGNTAITMNRIMPFNDMSDGSFEYMIKVKVHEYYHNINGSEVTGWSPFEIWLNEAVTVHIETEYLSYLVGDDDIRLDRVLTLLSPIGGTFDEDTSTRSIPIEPDGFNSPDELITGMTYVKAPELVRMIQQFIGKEKFVEGLALYHSRYKHSNATRKQWVECMEQVSGIKLAKMSDLWLKQTGFPILGVKTRYKKRELAIYFEQKTKNLWDFPLKFSLIGEKGEVIYTDQARINRKNQKILIQDVGEPLFVSLNQGMSFYGKVIYNQTQDELYSQVKLDPDTINKYIAFYKLADLEKLKLLKDKNSELSLRFIDLCFSLISDQELMMKVGASIVTIFESVEDEKYANKYEDLYQVREKILKSVALKYKKELIDLYNKLNNQKSEGTYVEKELKSIKVRQVKNTCLSLLSRLDTQDIHKLIKKQYDNSEKATDWLVALSLYIKSSAPDKLKLLEEHEKYARQNLVAWESFLAIVGDNESDDSLELIKKVEKSKSFRIEQSNDQRALYATFAGNKRKSLLTKEGRDFVKDVMIKLAPINEYNTMHVLEMFGKIDYLDDKNKIECLQVLLDVLAKLNKDKTPSIYNNIVRIIKNSKKSVKAYEKSIGKIKF